MSDSVLMPALGESVTEGTVTRWLKQVGDQVQVDEPLLEVSTDKVDTEIPSPFAGTLTEILVGEDETVEVGTALARIGSADEAGDAPAADQTTEQAPAPSAPQAAETAGADAASDSADAADQQQAAQVPEEVTAGEPAGSQTSTPQQAQESQQPQEDEATAAPEEQVPAGTSGGSGGGATQDVTMPALGESVTEGTVTRWLKQVGDAVALDEPLLEVSTDKVDTEIPSPLAGTLTEILVAEDETVEVGTPLARIGAEGAAPSGGGQPQAAPAPAAQPAAQPTETGGTSQPSGEPAQGEQQGGDYGPPPVAESVAEAEQEPGAGEQEPDAQAQAQASVVTAVVPEEPAQQENPVSAPRAASGQHAAAPRQTTGAADTAPGGVSGYLTPLVRKLAAEKGVDLSALRGTGVGGRIRKEDVLDAAQRAEQERAAREQAEQERAAQQRAEQERVSQAAPAAKAAASEPSSLGTSSVSPLRGTTEKASRLRQVIASRMVESLHSMAQLTTVVEVDVTKVARLRARAKNDFAAREGVNLTFLPFFVLAATEALKAHPKVNGLLDGNQITYHGEENVGIAVDTERGLVVPVIRGAGDLNLAGIARKIADLATRTRANKVTPDELSGGTFTVTNTGSGGALFDTPIVPVGTSAILGTGAIVKRPVVATDQDGAEYVAIRSMCYLALSYDHRLVDGADASRYLAAVKKRIEDGDFESEVGV